MGYKTTGRLQKYSTHWKRNDKIKYKQHCFLPAAPFCLHTWCYQSFLFINRSRLRLCNSSFPSKHHFADHFKAALFPHCSKQRFPLHIQTAVREVLWVWGSLFLAFTQQKLHHSVPLAISTQYETYTSVSVETLTCSYIWVRCTKCNTTKYQNPFASDGTTTASVDEICCPFLGWKQNKQYLFK